jgi:hypothetical protein
VITRTAPLGTPQPIPKRPLNPAPQNPATLQIRRLAMRPTPRRPSPSTAAHIHVGATYNDLGAQITGPQADLNLGIKTYVNGAPMNPIHIDTTQAATDTIQYVVTDSAGLTSASTRTVIIQAPSIVPIGDASTTATRTSATSGSQWPSS